MLSMKTSFSLSMLLICVLANAQSSVDVSQFNKKSEAKFNIKGNLLDIKWPSGNQTTSEILFDLQKEKPLFKSILLGHDGRFKEIANDLDPAFILTIGKR